MLVSPSRHACTLRPYFFKWRLPTLSAFERLLKNLAFCERLIAGCSHKARQRRQRFSLFFPWNIQAGFSQLFTILFIIRKAGTISFNLWNRFICLSANARTFALKSQLEAGRRHLYLAWVDPSVAAASCWQYSGATT